MIAKMEGLHGKLTERLIHLDEDISERELAIESIQRSDLIQYDRDSEIVTKAMMWPSFEYFKTAELSTLKKLRLASIEWSCSDCVKSLRFTLSDGTVSPILGSRPPNKFHDFEKTIRSVQVGVTKDNLIASLCFLDEANCKIVSIQGKDCEPD